MSITPKPEKVSKPDALRELYLQTAADDRGPSAQSSAAILERARQRVAFASKENAKSPSQAAANDRFWLRHALGGLAAVGLVGLLMLQHAAWWDGTDKGIGEQPKPSAAQAQNSTANEAVEAAVPDAADTPSTPSLTHEHAAIAKAPPAANKAARQEKSVSKLKENRAQVQEDKAPAAIDMEASAPMLEGSTDRLQERSERAATSAKARAPHAELAQKNAKSDSASITKDIVKNKSIALEEVAPSQNLEAQASLPLCPLTDDVPLKNAKTNGNGKGDAKKVQIDDSSSASKAASCRPRKAHELRQDKPASVPEAAEGIAQPVQ
ncbi:hypothetical protein KUF54_08545 [Comamonas sp. Y33R10-2]|uniref:hypothetical protein n=1 Tax=Comamonas sp. Y33R10-2 TaxID=2853257 RepID=UPI001C5CADE3|nr:hypothetical protein [Comamonas sp. Y33R10-2]QXZ11209.1 hypothetical protein KUF54_08545 [Comamonas sp. Y33R10-2]